MEMLLGVPLFLFQNGKCRTDLTRFACTFVFLFMVRGCKGLLIHAGAKVYFKFQAVGTTEHLPPTVEEQIGRQRQDIGKTHKGRLQDNGGGIS